MNARRSFRVLPPTRLPSKVSDPPETSCMPRIIRAKVVLPEPDSPMIAKISGRLFSIVKLTFFTASMRWRDNIPPRVKDLDTLFSVNRAVMRHLPQRHGRRRDARWRFGASWVFPSCRCHWQAGILGESGSPRVGWLNWAGCRSALSAEPYRRSGAANGSDAAYRDVGVR